MIKNQQAFDQALEEIVDNNDLFVFVKLGRYGIKEEQWDKIHEQWF